MSIRVGQTRGHRDSTGHRNLLPPGKRALNKGNTILPFSVDRTRWQNLYFYFPNYSVLNSTRSAFAGGAGGSPMKGFEWQTVRLPPREEGGLVWRTLSARRAVAVS